MPAIRRGSFFRGGWARQRVQFLEVPMSQQRRRKCQHCQQLYWPEPRNCRHQRYCSDPVCRKASKAASQKRWRASPQGRDYFRGTANRLRVQVWRKAHPGYWRTSRPKAGALQDHCAAPRLVPVMDRPLLNRRALQDLLATQGLALTGLVAYLTGSALQDHIASITRRLLLLGRQIHDPSGPRAFPGGNPGSGGQATAVVGSGPEGEARWAPGSG
jgi:hypothetical protein